MKKRKNIVVASVLMIMAMTLFASCGILSSDTVGGMARDSYRYMYGN
ncbi:MAG: hypothetical protein J5711_07395 [Bacteroidales bacterium]|nr:hypothetical protein [Bacteroidales bacterium]